MYKNEPYLIQYDTTKYPFRDIINKIFDLEEKKLTLEQIHHYKKYEVVKRENDQKTDWHAMYYEHFPNSFQTLYLALVEELKNRFGYKEIVYQRIPTFRVHLANGNLAVGEWHKDKTYNHGTTELNFWMPFGDTNEYNTIWMESEEDKGDYKPYTVKYGEILVFSGANLYHGNKNNESDETRVSVDFRLVEPARFKPSDSGSINMKVKFDIGGYFEKL
ncbi:MAG: hypothetical protein ACRC0I_11800 [Sediminibacterium sp.]|jgi:ectoine hydroxylase-related dioxygenase (phytanoyl-CoA dioxygenase family)|nr:hypothetical protein [Chitinophagaceae bacterium]